MNLPPLFKILIGLGLLAAGPIVVISAMIGAEKAAIGAIFVLVVYFMAIYIIGVRRYLPRDTARPVPPGPADKRVP